MQAYYGSNDTILGRLSALQLDLAAVLRGEVAAAPPVPELSPVHKTSPPVWKPASPQPPANTEEVTGLNESASSSPPQAQPPRTPAEPRRPSNAGSAAGASASMMRLTLSTREEEALRRHMLRVGAAARFKPEPMTPKVVEDSSEHHYQSHSAAPVVSSSGYSVGASAADDDRSHASFVAEEGGMQRYHEALRATGHKMTERFVPSVGLTASFARSATKQQGSSRHSLTQHQHSHYGSSSMNLSVADSQSGSSMYNRHVHHSYGSLPVRSAATEAYVQHFSPPDVAAGEITPGGGQVASRSRLAIDGSGGSPGARRTLISDNHRGVITQPLPPLADPHDHFIASDDEDVRSFDEHRDAKA